MGLFKRSASYDYFAAFIKNAESAVEAANYLNNALSEFDAARIPVHITEMHRIENRADDLKHELSAHLAHEFLPPIELEDISQLSQRLDDIVDSIEDVMRQLYMHNVTEIRPEAPQFCQLIVDCAEAFVRLMREFAVFKRSKSLMEHIIAINTLESTGDRLHETSLRRLYCEEMDPIAILVWSTRFEGLEKCLDTFEDTADMVESIVMKNGSMSIVGVETID